MGERAELAVARTGQARAFVSHAARPQARKRIYCFAHAGGSPAVFRDWPRHVPDSIEIAVAVLAGRGSRSAEACPSSLADVLDDLGPALRAHSDRPYALFGHSMGALVAFELALWCVQHDVAPPMHVFVAGLPAPSELSGSTRRPLHRLSAEKLIEHLRGLGGMPPELLADRDLLEVALPVLRSDLAVVETYRGGTAQLDVPLTALGGKSDPIGVGPIRRWRHHTRRSFAARFFEGGHFFPSSHLSVIGPWIARSV